MVTQLFDNDIPDIFKKSSNIKFHENWSSGSRVVLCGWTDRQTADRHDMLIVTFTIFQMCLKTAQRKTNPVKIFDT